jgi:FAD/FMN-containing dehydrogenase
MQTKLDALKQTMPSLAVSTQAKDLQIYGVDWTGGYQAAPLAVVFPRSTEQVQQLVHFARDAKQALVPSGGRTGLSAGAVASQGEIVVSFDKMNKIGEFNSSDRLLQVQAGVITQQVQDHVRAQGYYFPVDFASRGSSQIGGNIATNAGGIKVLRYGLLREWVAGLTVVTGSGEILQLNQGLYKNATGYDLRHLFIGSEGTLGFITEAQLRVTNLPGEQQVLLLAVPNTQHLTQLLVLFRQQLNLSAFEFFSELALQYVLTGKGVAHPFTQSAPYYVLIEYDASTQAAQAAALQVFEQGLEAGWIVDGIISQSQTQAAQLWSFRENISEIIAAYKPYKNDIAVKPSLVAPFLAELDTIMLNQYPNFNVVWFGHIGDGNLHLNVLKPTTQTQDEFIHHCQQVNQAVFSTVKRFGGTISAEHGVGLLKQPYLSYTRSAEEIAYLKQLKQVFDPDQIMNPGKLI